MPLPKNRAVITYELKLPSNGRTITYRPFLVSEQRILLMAMEGAADEKEIINAIKQIVVNCSEGMLTKDLVDAMPLFDLEYFFLKVRAKSVGEIVELKFKCQNMVGDKSCDAVSKIVLNLDQIESPTPIKNANKIMLGGTMGMIMKYPTFDIFSKLEGVNTNDLSKLLDFLGDMVDYVFDSDTIYRDFSKVEINDFLNRLTHEQFLKIGEFIQNIPTIQLKTNFNCNKCGYHEEITIKGLLSFFG
jgi:T4 bacteriophage base plate protein